MKGLLFGFGRMGITHIALFNKLVSADIEWEVFDPSWKTTLLVKLFGSLAGLKAISETELKGREYDIALICSPPQFHQSNFEAVRANTKKIFVEKPGFLEVENASNVYFGYVLRHAPCISELKRLLDGKSIKQVSVDIRANTVITDGIGWRASSDGGGVVNEFGSHAINLAKFITEVPFAVDKFKAEKVVSTACPDTCKIDASTKGGVSVGITLNWSDASVRKPTYKVSVVCEDGERFDTDLFQIWRHDKNEKTLDVSGVADRPSNCKFYIRGLEFSEQTKYFSENDNFQTDIEDSVFTDGILREYA